MNDFSRQPKILGFAGHREIPDPERMRGVIREELSELREKLGGRVIAISSACEGADLIFLRACVELRIPFIAILPFPKEKFSENSRDPAQWEMTEKLLSVALTTYVAPGGKDSPEAYQVVSRNLIEWADAFLFVWDGQPALGPGGTGETVEEARDIGIPARIIDSETLAARWMVPLDEGRKAKHGFATRQDLLDFLDLRYEKQGKSLLDFRPSSLRFPQ